MSNTFEENVMLKLDSIDARLSSLEEKINDATNFSDSILGEGSFSAEGLESIRNTFASLMSGGDAESDEGPGDMSDLITSLRSFQDRLTSVKEAISELPTQEEDKKS